MTPGTRSSSSQNTSSTQSVRAFQEAARRGAYASAKDQVMIEFQRTSLEMAKRFLETQQNVMLAYLNNSQDPNGYMVPVMPQLLNAMTPIEYVQEPQLLQAAIPSNGAAANPPHGAAAIPTNGSVSFPSNGSAAVPSSGSLIPTNGTAAVPANGSHSVPSNGSAITNNGTAAIPLNGSAHPASAHPSNGTVSPNSASANPEQLIASLIDIVSERTGYPPEMLDPELDLEADLGIDSIKRVEILNSFRKLLPEGSQNFLEDGIEKLAGVKTLSGIMEWIRTDLVQSTQGNDAAQGSESAKVSILQNTSVIPSQEMERELV